MSQPLEEVLALAAAVGLSGFAPSKPAAQEQSRELSTDDPVALARAVRLRGFSEPYRGPQ